MGGDEIWGIAWTAFGDEAVKTLRFVFLTVTDVSSGNFKDCLDCLLRWVTVNVDSEKAALETIQYFA